MSKKKFIITVNTNRNHNDTKDVIQHALKNRDGIYWTGKPKIGFARKRNKISEKYNRCPNCLKKNIREINKEDLLVHCLSCGNDFLHTYFNNWNEGFEDCENRFNLRT